MSLTFFDKDFYTKVERLNLNSEQIKDFIKDMCSLTPKERDILINKITHFLA